MGLFDRVKGAKDAEVKLNKDEAFAGVALAAIAADGVITQEEANGLIVSLVRMKTFAGYNDKMFINLLNKLVAIIQKQGLDALISQSKEGLDPNMRETAFAVACDLSLADGELAAQEKDILTKLQVGLGLSEDKAVNIIEVMLIKNKG
jgi:tellurite resistance protein